MHSSSYLVVHGMYEEEVCPQLPLVFPKVFKLKHSALASADPVEKRVYDVTQSLYKILEIMHKLVYIMCFIICLHTCMQTNRKKLDIVPGVKDTPHHNSSLCRCHMEPHLPCGHPLDTHWNPQGSIQPHHTPPLHFDTEYHNQYSSIDHSMFLSHNLDLPLAGTLQHHSRRQCTLLDYHNHRPHFHPEFHFHKWGLLSFLLGHWQGN